MRSCVVCLSSAAVALSSHLVGADQQDSAAAGLHSYLVVGAAYHYDAFIPDPDHEDPAVRVEYRDRRELLPGLRPWLGVEMAVPDRNLLTYLGLSYEVDLGAGFFFLPSFGSGRYWHLRGEDLGGPIENRTQLEIGWGGADLRCSIAFAHISNGGFLAEHNPGAEAWSFLLWFPLR